MFPKPKEKTSGILVPTYGEETRRGFFLRDGGYYWYVNDYMDIRATGTVFSNGGYGGVFNTNFKKRYVFTGGLNFSYNKNIIDNEIGYFQFFRLNMKMWITQVTSAVHGFGNVHFISFILFNIFLL